MFTLLLVIIALACLPYALCVIGIVFGLAMDVLMFCFDILGAAISEAFKIVPYIFCLLLLVGAISFVIQCYNN
jgi:hypothetical protein